MVVAQQTPRVRTLEPTRRVVGGSEPMDFEVADRVSAREFIRRTGARTRMTAWSVALR